MLSRKNIILSENLYFIAAYRIHSYFATLASQCRLSRTVVAMYLPARGTPTRLSIKVPDETL